MKKNAAIALAGVLIVAVAGGWWSMSADKLGTKNAKTTAAAGNGGPAGGGAPALVTLATAEKQDVPVTVQVNGSVVSLNSVDLRPQVTNTVSTVHVKEGQFVKAGQLLFSLDDRNDQANLARARAQQQKDEATMADLERQYKRSQDLVAQNFIAKSAADATLSQLEAQRAAVAADRAAVQSAQVALGYATLRAPIAGRIGAVNIYPGTLVQPTLSLVTVTQLDPIAVSFPVPEGNLQDLLEAARSRSPVEALVTGRKTPLIGSLDFVDNTVDPQIGTVRAKAVFANADQGLWPGQFVGTRITVRTLSGVTVVPAAALMMLSDGTSLYVVDQAKTATRRKVKTLHTFGTKVAVSGVEPGEQVVIEGSQNVRPGGKVRVDAKGGGPGTAPNGTTGVTPGSAASSEGTDVKPPQRERA
ncbi:RND family efflux transporter, MFP subunit [Variovorax sp. 770b2]|jgi:multidrug efflux system membrane fusion protein|nr:RND family efflux transporter, MFP subunit [Variovorax sp. 770b2]